MKQLQDWQRIKNKPGLIKYPMNILTWLHYFHLSDENIGKSQYRKKAT